MFKNTPRSNAGRSLLESVGMGVILVLLLIYAAPTFKDFLDKGRTTSLTKDMTVTLEMARKEAMSRRQSVSVQGVGGGLNWSKGWTVRTDEGGILSERGPVYEGFIIFTATESGESHSRVEFDQWGALKGGGTFHINICRPPLPNPIESGHITVNPKGQIKAGLGTMGSPASLC